MSESDPLDSPARLFLHRETVALVVLIACAVGGFFMTRAAAMANRRTRRHDAAAWFARGEQNAAASRQDNAVTALRRAVAIDRDNLGYQLALGTALTAVGQDADARQVLLAARAQVPEDPHVNLQLARIEAARGDSTAAEQYYHNALYGSWTAEDTDVRRAVRAELIRHLLDRGEKRRALSELIVLGGNAPDEPASQLPVARMFLDAGDPRQALDHFNRVLAREPANGGALAGAGEAAFELQDYPRAVRYLTAAPADPRTADLRHVADLVIADDPLRARLAPRDRQVRALRGLTTAAARLDACGTAGATPSPLRAEIDALAHALTPRALARRPDLIDDALALIVRARQAGDGCGPATAEDRAWIRIGRLHAVEAQ